MVVDGTNIIVDCRSLLAWEAFSGFNVFCDKEDTQCMTIDLTSLMPSVAWPLFFTNVQVYAETSGACFDALATYSFNQVLEEPREGTKSAHHLAARVSSVRNTRFIQANDDYNYRIILLSELECMPSAVHIDIDLREVQSFTFRVAKSREGDDILGKVAVPLTECIPVGMGFVVSMESLALRRHGPGSTKTHRQRWLGDSVSVPVPYLRLCLNEMSTHSFWRRLLFRKTHVYRVLISFKHSCRYHHHHGSRA
jgi:hypothetical protein